VNYKLTTPISEEDVRKLKVGDVIYLSGTVVSCRDLGHKRALEYLKRGKKLPLDLTGLALYHVGPIAKRERGKWVIVSAGPTTSARMEAYEAELIERTGLRLIIGKGGMGAKTTEACKRFGAAYAIFPGGAGALAARFIEKVEKVEWMDLGMPEAMWILKVRNFGPLMIAIDSHGRNFYKDRRQVVRENLSKAYSIIELL